MPLTPTLASDQSAASGTPDTTGAKDKGGTDSNVRGGHQRRFGAKPVAVWTEPDAGARKVLNDTRMMAGTDVWAEVGAEWRPGDTEPSMSRDPAAWLKQQGLQAHGTGPREQPAIAPASSILAETVAPILAKPLGLLSKAVWTRGFSSSLSKTSAPATKASSLRPSSSPPPASNRETQTAAASTSSLVYVNSNSSASNSSSHWGKELAKPGLQTHLLASS